MSANNKLYMVGPRSGNTSSRAVGAEMAGWEVHWSTPSWTDGMNVWRRAPQYRLRNGPDIFRYNQSLVTGAIRIRPDVVWVESPIFIYPSTLVSIKNKTGATLVCAYSDDPRDPNKKSRHFDRSIAIYDVIFTTKDELNQLFLSYGCRTAVKFWKGYAPERIFPLQLTSGDAEEYRSDVAFIGHADLVKDHSTRLAPLEAVARVVPETQIWGRSWKRVKWPRDLPGVIHAYQLYGLEYTKAICATKIALQIPSRLAHDTHSSRSVEIPACRVAMLAERTADHQVLFEEDKEAIFFNGIPELVENAKYYLNHEAAREKIAQAGYERCIRSGYSNYDRMRQMLAFVFNVRKDK
jgi:hypothetical protein